MSHDTVILKIIGGTLHEMLGDGDLVIPRGMERISDSGYLNFEMMPPCIDSITVEDVLDFLRQNMTRDHMSLSVITPKEV